MQLNRKARPEILDSVALLVIDAQDRLIDTISDKEGFKQRAAFAIEAARCLKLHTLFTEQAPEKLGRTNSDLYKLAYKPTVFPKQSFSALGAPGMERFLRENEIYNLLVVGLETPICIYQTGLQASEEDIDITLLSDCLGARRPQDEAATLTALSRLGCQVLPSETIFYSLLSDTQSPYFSAFTQIVKAFAVENFSLETYLANRPAEVQETPERPQKPQRKERSSEERNEGRHEERHGQRHDERHNERTQESGEKETSPKHQDDSEERREPKRGRRRGRGRGRDRRDGDSPESSRDPQKATPSDRQDAPRDTPPDNTPRSQPQTDKPKQAPKARPEKPMPEPKAAAAEQEPAKKPIKKTAKNAPKKVAKKAAKKVAKKVKKAED